MSRFPRRNGAFLRIPGYLRARLGLARRCATLGISALALALVFAGSPARAHAASPQAACGDIFGKVFNDLNRNGAQDAGEHGVGGVTLVMLDGRRITTDRAGAYHAGCVGVSDTGSTNPVLLKIAPESLPNEAYVLQGTSREVHITSAKATKLNFPLARKHDVRMVVQASAFADGAAELKPLWIKDFDRVVAILERQPSTLRLSYHAGSEVPGLSRARADALRRLISQRWQGVSRRYDLPIEVRVVSRP